MPTLSRILLSASLLGLAAFSLAAPLAQRILSVDADGRPMEGGPSPEAVVKGFRKSGARTLLLHFHGGLVDAEQGLIQARHMDANVYRDPETFPAYVVWNSGWGDVVQSLRSEPGVFQNMFSPGVRPYEVRLPHLEAIRRTRHYVDSVRSEGRVPVDVEAELRDYYRRNIRGLEEEDILTLAAAMKGWTTEALGWSRTNPLVTPQTPDVRKVEMQYGFLIRSGWDEMKRYIDGSNEITWGATNRMIQALRTDPPERIVLVGHSAGAIYATRFLRRAAERLPGTRFDVLYLEPAITYHEMAEAVPLYRARVDHFRMFAMDDATARRNSVLNELGVIDSLDRSIGRGRFSRLYPGSLLYVVSNILEGDADTPMIALQRFRMPDLPLTESERQDRTTVDSYLDWTRDVAWSHGGVGPPDPRPGYATQATQHGGIWREPVTNGSMVKTLEQWATGS
ncbi:hypothetical protein EON81_07090 [bacterium]|nr:MAG: hypothetical protein EON81_07090 [bacterium]